MLSWKFFLCGGKHVDPVICLRPPLASLGPSGISQSPLLRTSALLKKHHSISERLTLHFNWGCSFGQRQEVGKYRPDGPAAGYRILKQTPMCCNHAYLTDSPHRPRGRCHVKSALCDNGSCWFWVLKGMLQIIHSNVLLVYDCEKIGPSSVNSHPQVNIESEIVDRKHFSWPLLPFYYITVPSLPHWQFFPSLKLKLPCYHE